MEPVQVHPAFCQYGLPGIVGPVLVAVPHAGREYPVEVVARSRVGLAGLQSLEDRYADVLAVSSIAAGHCALIARRGRALIDLNRHEGEIDNASVADIPHGVGLRSSVKLRGGLGLVPHRYHCIGDLWLRRPPYSEVRARIEQVHAPYHAQVEALLAETFAEHGAALLVDLHSMPPIKGQGRFGGAQVVIGDRFGQSAASGIARLAAERVEAHGFRVATNSPYAGGYTLERHGRPQFGVHAIQIEVDRSLYLDATLDQPGEGAGRCTAMVADLMDMLSRELGGRMPLAAE